MSDEATLCMFCGKDESFGEMTVEHFVPRCLWNDARPSKTRTVPAHKTCNERFSADNEYFRDVLAMEDGANIHQEVKKLHAGKIKRKFEKKFGSIKRTLKDLQIRNVLTPSGIYLGTAPSFRVDWPRMERVLQNIMRGIFCSVKERPLPQDMNMRVVVATDKILLPVTELIGKMNPWVGFGDDVFRCRYVFNDGEQDAMACLLQFYGRRVFFGCATPFDMIAADKGAEQICV